MPRLFKRPLFWLAALVVLGGGGTFVAYKTVSGSNQAQAEEIAPAESPYITVANGKADVEGGIIPVAARRGGIVRDVYVQEGDLVKKDQILARQEDDEARLSLARSRAQLEQSRAQIASTQVQIDAAKRELERMQALATRGFATTQQTDRLVDDVLQLEATLAAQHASIAVAQAAVEEATYNVELTVIRSPVDGRVVRRYANPGAGASTLNVSTMFDIEPDAERIVRAEVTESAISDIAVGAPIEIVPESDNTIAYPGTVLRRAGLYGARRLASDNPSERLDDRVVEVVVSAEDAPLLIGQRVLVRFLKPDTQVAVSEPAQSTE
jgi:multidrug efflux pump subunit AcrA (membrane-fusion protein)